MTTSFDNFSIGLFIWSLVMIAGFVFSIFLLIKLYYHLKE